MSPSCAEITTRLRAARYENGAALLLGSRFPHPSGAMRWAHLGIVQLMREKVVHRLWTRTCDPHWSRICAFYELLPENIDAATWNGEFTEAGDSRSMAVVSVQGCHPSRFEDLIRQENVSLWIAAALGPEETGLADALASLHPGSVLVVPATDVDAYFQALADEFGGIQFATPSDHPSDRLRQAAVAQLMRKLTRTEQLVEFERSMQATAIAQAANGQNAMREVFECPVAEVPARAEYASRLYEIASRLLPSAAAYSHWGRSLREAGARLTGLKAARLYRQAAERLRQAGRINVNDHTLFDDWTACMGDLRRSTPREAGRAVTAEIDREFQWRIAHGAELPSQALVKWARVLLEWALSTSGEESRKLFALARTRMDEAKRRATDLEPLHTVWADMLCRQAAQAAPEEAARLLQEALHQVSGTLTPEACLLRARGHFQLAGLPDQPVKEHVAQGDEAVQESITWGAPRNEATSQWGQLYVGLALARSRQQQPDSSGYLAYAQNLFAQAEDYRGWSASLLTQARTTPGLGTAKRQILETAREHALEAESRTEGSAAFDLARLAAALRDEDACRGWLSKASRCGAIPALTHLLEEAEFAPYRQKPWFREFTGV